MKKILASALVFAMILSLGVSAFADGGEIVVSDGKTHNFPNRDEYPFDEITGGIDVSNNTVVIVAEGNNVSNENGTGIKADGADVVVKDGNVSGKDKGVYANSTNNGSEAIVNVNGNVSGGITGVEAISEDEGSTIVNVDKNVEAAGIGITASGSGTNVSLTDGNVTVTGVNGSGVNAKEGGTVSVQGSVKAENGAGVFADAGEITVTKDISSDAMGADANNGTIKVGGNVTVSEGEDAVSARNDSTVLVEGTVTGNVNSDASTVYLGELNGTITAGSELVHYLFSLTEKSLTMDDLTVVGENTVLMDTSVKGVSKSYIPTYSAAQLSSGTAAITIKPNQTGRELNFSGLPSTVKVTQNNGEYTLTLTSDFKGGLTAVQILLKEIAHDNPDSGAEVYINTDILPFIFVDNGYLIEAIKIELPEGAEEGAVLPLEIPNHAGIRVAPSLLIPTVEYHMAQLFLDNIPVPESAFSITSHGDGSLSIQMSNTYLLSLGSGTYNFRALVDRQEIFFTVVVAKQAA